MGKHHWKVEKQPEWYVKAVRKTIAALPGGYAEAADWLDVTENALFNRLRADGDQIFPLGWAMILQRAGGTHFIADAVAQSANGVFVSLPDVEDVDNADINQRLLEVIEQIGSYSKQIRSAIEDGVVEPHEKTAINDELTAMRRMFISLTLRSFRPRHFLNCQILTRQNLTHQNLTRQNMMRRNLAKKRVFTRQNLAGIRQ